VRRSSLAPAPPGWEAPPSCRIRLEIELPAPPERVFATLLDPESWPVFFPGIREIRYLDPAPWGVGARREVWMPGLWFRERFDVVDPPRAWAFHHEAATGGLLRHFHERYALRPVGQGTHLDWRVDLLPARAAWPLVPVAMPILRALFRRGARNLAAHLQEIR
jgi:carbon monoxide dehydrogenase subunit G